VHIDPRLQRIAILKKKKKKKEKNTDTGTSKSVSNAAAAAAASDTLERLGPLLATVRGGEDLILHGRGRRKLTPHNRSAILASLSSSSSSITSSSSPPTRASHDRYSFLSGTRLQVCGRGGVCVNASRGGVAPDGLSINVSLPHVADLWRGGAAADHSEDDDGGASGGGPCLGEGIYLTVRVSVPLSASYFSAGNVTFECFSGGSGDEDEARRVTVATTAATASFSPATCASTCGGDDFSGCPSFDQGGALYLLRDTCAEYEQKDYNVCLDPVTAATCGYHVSSSSSSSSSCGSEDIVCEPCPSAALCPGGPRIWPRLGHWIGTERPPLQGTGVSPNPLPCAAPARARCLGWDVEAETTRCGPGYASGAYLCAECDDGYYSTFWNRSCSPCVAADDQKDGLRASTDEAIVVLLCFVAVLLLLAGGVFLVATFVGGNRRQGMYRGRRLVVYSISSMQIVAQISQQATGYEDPAVLKLYGYLSLVTTLDSSETLPQECWRDDRLGPFFAPNAIMSVLLVGFALWAWLCFVLPSERRRRGDGVCRFSFKLQQKLLAGMTLLYPLGARIALRSIVCVRVVVPGAARGAGASASGGQDDTMSMLQARPTIPCFGSAHAANGVLGYATLVLVCLGFPACLLWLVRCSKQFDQGVVASVRLQKRKTALLTKMQKKRKQIMKKTLEGGGAEEVAAAAAAAAAGTVEMTPADASFHGSQINPYFQQASVAAEGVAGDGGGGNTGAAPCSSAATAIQASASTTTKPRRHSHMLVGQPTSVQAFVRYKPEHLVAFRSLVESDYRLAFLGFRPAYLYLLLLLSVGTVVFPPSSPHAVPRLCFSVAIIVLYYTAFLCLRPLRRSRRWILPVQMSIFAVGVLALALSAIAEISDLEGGQNTGLVRALSFVIVVFVALIIGVVIPAAATYDLVTSARREILMARNRREILRKESDTSVSLSGRLEGAQGGPGGPGGAGRDKDRHFDEATGAYYTHNTRSGSTHWVAEPGGEQGVVGVYAERETHLDDATGAYYTFNTRSGSTRWVEGLSDGYTEAAEAVQEEGRRRTERLSALRDVEFVDAGASTKDAAVLDVCETMAPPHASEVAPASSTQARPVAECTADVASSTSTSSKTKTKTRRGQKPRPDVNTSELMRRTRLKRVRSAEKMRKKMLRRADTDVLSVPGYDPRHFSVNSTRGEWSVVVDDRNGKTMYYNPSTREMRATRPEGWVRMLAKTATPG
jgi:hypothetical protein